MNLLIASVFLLLAMILAGLYFISNYRGLNQSAKYWSWAVLLDAVGLLLMAVMFVATNTFDGLSAVARNASWFSNIALLGSAMYQTLSLKAIRTKIRVKDLQIVWAGLFLFALSWKLLVPVTDVNDRVYVFAVLALILMGRQLYHLWRARQIERTSRQIKVLLVSISVEVIFTLIRIVLIANVNSTILHVEQLPALALFSVWLQYGMKIIAYGSILGYWSERMTIEKTKTELENLQFKMLSERQEKMIADLGRLNKAATAGVLAASIAHELSQPLQSMILNNSIAVDALSRDALDRQQLQLLLKDQSNNADRMAQIITTLRGVFTESGTNEQNIDFYEVISGLDLLVQPQARKRNIALTYQLEPDCRVSVKFSELQQVLLNLIGNAFDALINNKTDSPRVLIHLHREHHHVICSIEDNGPGISEYEQNNMFKFLKTSKADGMGLGLWLSKYIIERSRGEIYAKRSSLGGAAFVIRLPIMG